VIENVDV